MNLENHQSVSSNDDDKEQSNNSDEDDDDDENSVVYSDDEELQYSINLPKKYVFMLKWIYLNIFSI